jgi:hypothetical protein
MSEFSVNEAALDEIRRILRRGKHVDPIARIYERADAGNLFDNLKIAMTNGTKITDDLLAIGRGKLEETEDQLQSSLMIGVCERSDFMPEDLCEIGGVKFVMGIWLAEILHGYTLTFDGNAFWLRGANNVTHTLRSLARRHHGAKEAQGK